jgi:predicted ribosome quality control (RQC) complex YloA/Tae2 family protein
VKTCTFHDYGALLDGFYGERIPPSACASGPEIPSSLVGSRIERLRRKLALQEQELKESADREQLRITRDLLSAHIQAFQRATTGWRCRIFMSKTRPLF